MSVMIVTSLGEMVVDLFTDRCPLTCKNFLKLCKIKYYNGCFFHTVQKDFTAQTGDPTGTGSGGDSVYKFLYGDQARFFGDEIHLDVKHSKIGTVAMASAGENLNASQFYITLRADLDYLDGKHTVFGVVAEGLETLTRINEAFVDEKSRPYKNIRVKHTYILDDPFDDPPELAELIPDASPEGKPKDEVDDDVRLEDDWIPMDEQLNPQELEEVLREKEAHSRALVLETIGDLPEAESKPPDNVLFVCKLNPVTEDEDLHTIFSRFGVVTSAEIIRDHKTGDSLCYAFIEFEDKDACEQAYFKMENALIDDRRIHVDFSQSVAKLWSEHNRKVQMGRGCFKCGSLDHVAKDCTGDSTFKSHSKYILKDDNTQRGGDGSTRYEMVFDDDDDGRTRHSKRRRDHNAEEYNEKQNSEYAYKPKDLDERRRDTRDWQSRHERTKERTEDYGDDEYNEKQNSKYAYKPKDPDERGRDTRDWPSRQERTKERKEDYGDARRQRSPYRGGAKDYPEKNGSSDGRKTDVIVQNSRDDREHKRRHGNDAGHKYRRDHREHEKNHGDGAGYGYKRDERKYEKRLVDDVGRGDKKNENETKKKTYEDLRGSHRDRHDGDDNYGHKRRDEERYSDKRSSKGDDLRDRARRH